MCEAISPKRAASRPVSPPPWRTQSGGCGPEEIWGFKGVWRVSEPQCITATSKKLKVVVALQNQVKNTIKCWRKWSTSWQRGCAERNLLYPVWPVQPPQTTATTALAGEGVQGRSGYDSATADHWRRIKASKYATGAPVRTAVALVTYLRAPRGNVVVVLVAELFLRKRESNNSVTDNQPLH